MPVLPPLSGGQLTAAELAGIQAANDLSEENPAVTNGDLTDALANYVIEADSYFKSPTSQAEVDYTSIANARNKIVGKYIPTVSFEAGDCVIPSFDNILTKIKLVGDIRTLVGLSFAHGETIQSTAEGCGSGVVSLSSSGNIITIAASVSNPDFSQLVNGDKLLICNTSGTISAVTIDSVSGHQITITTAAPTINAEGASVTIIPNRRITSQLILPIDQDIIFQGFYFDSVVTSPGIDVLGVLKFQNCCVYSNLDINVNLNPFSYFESLNSTFVNVSNLLDTTNWRSAIYLQNGAACKLTTSHIVKHGHGVFNLGGSCFMDKCCTNYAAMPFKTRYGGKNQGNHCFLVQSTTALSTEFASSSRFSNITIHYSNCACYVDNYSCSEVLTSYALRSNVSNWAIASGGTLVYS